MNFFLIIFSITIIIIIIGLIVNINSYNFLTIKNKIEKIFLLNLERRKDRLEIFKKTYNLNMPFTTIKAVDGKLLIFNDLLQNNLLGNVGKNSIFNIKNNKSRKHHYELTHNGSIGCYLSHINIWKNIKDNNLDNVLIFEDDTKMNKINLNEINYRLADLPKNWDIYLLSNPKLCYYKKKVNNKNLFKVKRFFLLNAYIINQSGIDKIFNSNTLFPINQQIDSYLSELALDYNLNIYVHNNKYKYYEQFDTLGSDIQIASENNLSYDRLKLK
jgi:GR25 family glycosyltransferase involved in LPS biosynthesis